jgi:hypothetical protein
MNTNKSQPARTTTESCMIHAASEWNTEHLQSINTPMTHLPLSGIPLRICGKRGKKRINFSKKKEDFK